MGPADARFALLDGHARVLIGMARHPDQSAERRETVAQAPRPWAAILGCADARVPPEILFDQGYGSLFVVRIAGNAVPDVALASLEIAVTDLAVPLVVVLGHTRCRAIELALAAPDEPDSGAGHVAALIESLAPATIAVSASSGDRLTAAVRANVRLTAARLAQAEPVLAPAVRCGALEVAGWLYDVDTGLLELLA